MAALAVAAFACIALASTACSKPPSPRGWAAAVPIEIQNTETVLVPHKGKLFALPDNSSAVIWQFPPVDRATYPLSEDGATRIKDAVDATSIESTAKKELDQKIDDVRLAGPTKDALKDAIDLTDMTSDEKSAINKLVDESVKFESDAQKKLKAIYGDLGLTADQTTTYVATFRGMLFALDTETGMTRWVRDAGEEMVGGVAVDGDEIYVGTRGRKLFALDGRTGEQIWSFEARDQVWSTPIVEGDSLYGTSLDGTVFALKKDTGKQIWEFTGTRSGIAGRPALAEGTLYVGAFDNRLYAIDAADGTMKWTAKADNWFWSTPVVQDGIVYAASLDGKMYAVKAADGTAAWEEPFDTGAPVRAAPVIVGGGLVVASRDAQLHKLDLKTGKALEGSPVPVGDETKVEADLTLGTRGRVYVAPYGPYLYVFEATGALRSLGGFPLSN